jgi:hypothetical protein
MFNMNDKGVNSLFFALFTSKEWGKKEDNLVYFDDNLHNLL